jgi:uncharacterized protein
MNAEHVLPIKESERLISLDILRGIALFGILLMNITGFGLPAAYSDPTNYGGATGPNLWAWMTTTMLFEGTQRAIFSLLFGAGVILLTERIDRRGGNSADIYFRRNLWLIVFGIVHAYLLLWTGEILYYYGLTALFVYSFRKATPRTLYAVALSGLLFNAAWNQLDVHNGLQTNAAWREAVKVQESGGVLSAEQSESIDDWKDLVKDMKPGAEKIQKQIEAKRGSYLDVLVFQAPKNSENQSWGAYRYFFDIFSFMLIGMAMFKNGLLTLSDRRAVYVKMMLFGYGTGLAVNYFEVRHLLASNFDVLARIQADVTYDLGRLAMTTGHLGLLMLFCNSGILSGLKQRLASVGQMALSNYIGASVICAFVFYGFGFGLFAQLQRYQLYYVVLAIWLVQLIASPIWLKHYRFGPLEWLWRSLTYGERQPMRRDA